MRISPDMGEGIQKVESKRPDERTLASQSTADLIHLYKKGDVRALNLLLDRYIGPIHRWARGRLPPYARTLLETDDLVQNTMIRTLNRIDSFKPRHPGAFQSYLRQGVLNAIRDEIRRVSAKPVDPTDMERVMDHRPSPLQEAIGQETLDRYERALSKLSPTDQELVANRVELGLSYSEIALSCGKPSADAARMAVSRALLRLAEGMTR